MANQRNIDAIEEGAAATAVAGAIKSTVDEKMREKVTLLMSYYRGGKIDHDMLVGGVAEITALADLMSDLENKALRGEVAAKREFGEDAQKS